MSDYIVMGIVCAWLSSPIVLAVIDYINEGIGRARLRRAKIIINGKGAKNV